MINRCNTKKKVKIQPSLRRWWLYPSLLCSLQ